MRVDLLRVADLRCHAAGELLPVAGVTAIVGPNGSGKTSLLEAVHLGTNGTGLRPTADSRMIRDGADELGVRVEGEAGGASTTTRVRLTKGARTLELDGVQVDGRTLRERWASVVFIPDVLDLVKRGPSVRRVAMDRAIEGAWPRFEEHERAYRQTMEQRNAVLRRVRRREGAEDELDPWDRQLADHGALITEARERLVERLAPFFEERVELLGSPHTGGLRYEPSLPGDGAALLAALRERRRSDIERQTTGIGPHLDDLVVELSGRDARRSASQGEQRTLVLAFLLAQAALISETRGEPPLLLLDDVLSELDRDRRTRLIELGRQHGQVILTATGADGVDDLADLVHTLEVLV
jgi:DNA replication and repair protein RecF